MAWYTVVVSDHPEALTPGPQSAEVAASWRVVFDGRSTLASVRLLIAGALKSPGRAVRVFRGKGAGKLVEV